MYTFNEGGLYRDVRSRVASRLREELADASPKLKAPKGGCWSLGKVCVSIAVWLSMLHLAINAGRTSSAVVASFCAGLALSLFLFEWMHGASHFALSASSSRNELLNSIAQPLVYWDAGTWQGHHVLHHHVYTGSVALDPDVTHLWPILRKISYKTTNF